MVSLAIDWTLKIKVSRQTERAGLKLRDKLLSDNEMYNIVSEMSPAVRKFHAGAMLKALHDQKKLNKKTRSELLAILISDFDQTLSLSLSLARGLGLIDEDELTDRFRLIDEYV